ncbi:hypothetical protein BLNAU_20507 [Blattamonas nauphoetae]|uniref:Uncharacterized protein n=1 Tax=Blattamonas nauphoetae TaxID=2049346 RepID=A0ABQ9WZ13_9EUKA|nr:hypothetical protein BLNAU_20507 [Blattamonas nauphoetae]
MSILLSFVDTIIKELRLGPQGQAELVQHVIRKNLFVWKKIQTGNDEIDENPEREVQILSQFNHRIIALIISRIEPRHFDGLCERHSQKHHRNANSLQDAERPFFFLRFANAQEACQTARKELESLEREDEKRKQTTIGEKICSVIDPLCAHSPAIVSLALNNNTLSSLLLIVRNFCFERPSDFSNTVSVTINFQVPRPEFLGPEQDKLGLAGGERVVGDRFVLDQVDSQLPTPKRPLMSPPIPPPPQMLNRRSQHFRRPSDASSSEIFPIRRALSEHLLQYPVGSPPPFSLDFIRNDSLLQSPDAKSKDDSEVAMISDDENSLVFVDQPETYDQLQRRRELDKMARMEEYKRRLAGQKHQRVGVQAQSRLTARTIDNQEIFNDDARALKKRRLKRSIKSIPINSTLCTSIPSINKHSLGGNWVGKKSLLCGFCVASTSSDEERTNQTVWTQRNERGVEECVELTAVDDGGRHRDKRFEMGKASPSTTIAGRWTARVTKQDERRARLTCFAFRVGQDSISDQHFRRRGDIDVQRHDWREGGMSDEWTVIGQAQSVVKEGDAAEKVDATTSAQPDPSSHPKSSNPNFVIVSRDEHMSP